MTDRVDKFAQLPRAFVFQGRILGITIGCLIGMTPLMFIDSDKDKEKTKKEAEAAVAVAEATIARK